MSKTETIGHISEAWSAPLKSNLGSVAIKGKSVLKLNIDLFPAFTWILTSGCRRCNTSVKFCFWRKYSGFFCTGVNKADTYLSGCSSLPCCHTRIRKASFKALLISPVSSGPFPNKGFGFPPPHPNKADASKAHKVEAQGSEARNKNAPFRQRLPLLSALMSSRSVGGGERKPAVTGTTG